MAGAAESLVWIKQAETRCGFGRDGGVERRWYEGCFEDERRMVREVRWSLKREEDWGIGWKVERRCEGCNQVSERLSWTPTEGELTVVRPT